MRRSRCLSRRGSRWAAWAQITRWAPRPVCKARQRTLEGGPGYERTVTVFALLLRKAGIKEDTLHKTLAETFLFHHPAAWGVSKRIREEREHCCDDIAVVIRGDPVCYAAERWDR